MDGISDRRSELFATLWRGSDVLRSKMDANEYKNYLLGFIFYKYLSDSYLYKTYDLLFDEKPGSMKEAQEAYEEAWVGEDVEDLKAELMSSLRYVIDPKFTFYRLAEDARKNIFLRENLKKAFNDVESSDPLFAHLFDDVDLYSTRLGVSDTKQSATVSELMKELDKADLLNVSGDVLGAAYEYLIGQFASETGKKAGEFYTPKGPAELLTRIAILGQEDKMGLLIYDPCMGSASLLLDVQKFAKYPKYIKYYGQELVTSTYNLARMNMFLHGIAPENQHLHNADTLDADWPTDEESEFDIVATNPPYSSNWAASPGFLSDERFSDYGVLAPKSKADYAFLLHGLFHLKSGGTMAIVLPHGVLFRGAAEGTIRRKLLENGNICAVIGLGPNMFMNTSIPVCIIVLQKHRKGRDVLFIDASKQFEKGKKQNYMKDEHVAHIMDLYKGRKDVEKEAHLASFDEIKENDFNLNIPRYVDSSEDEKPIDPQNLMERMRETNAKIKTENKALLDMFGDLVFSNPQTEKEMSGLFAVLREA